jgi:alpha-glucosidase
MRFEKRRLKQVVVSSFLVCLMIFTMCSPAFARDSQSTRQGTALYPLYWTAYEPCYTADAPLSEARWKANIDWVADTLLPYGYNMVGSIG